MILRFILAMIFVMVVFVAIILGGVAMFVLLMQEDEENRLNHK